MTVQIRMCREADLELLPLIEIASGQAFEAIGMSLVARMEPSSASVLRPALVAERLFVAVVEDYPIGFLQLEFVDEHPHVQQVSVHPSYSRKGVGASLLTTAEAWSEARAHTTITLTTYRDVPWNAPYYARLGWRELHPGSWGRGLMAARQHERLLGLDAWPRIAMVKALRP